MIELKDEHIIALKHLEHTPNNYLKLVLNGWFKSRKEMPHDNTAAYCNI